MAKPFYGNGLFVLGHTWLSLLLLLLFFHIQTHAYTLFSSSFFWTTTNEKKEMQPKTDGPRAKERESDGGVEEVEKRNMPRLMHGMIEMVGTL